MKGSLLPAVREDQSDVRPDRIAAGESNFMCFFGRKGSGKSHLAKLLWSQWTGPKMLIDVVGDVDAGPGAKTFREPIESWPVDGDDKLIPVIVYRPDFGAHDDQRASLDDIDRMIGVAYEIGDVLIWIDEGHVCTPGWYSKQMRNWRRVLIHGRHRNVSLLFCGPRPLDIDPTIVMQADHLILFHLPEKKARERLAENTGWPSDDLHYRHSQLGEYEFLWLNVKQNRMRHYPAIKAQRQRIKHVPREG